MLNPSVKDKVNKNGLEFDHRVEYQIPNWSLLYHHRREKWRRGILTLSCLLGVNSSLVTWTWTSLRGVEALEKWLTPPTHSDTLFLVPVLKYTCKIYLSYAKPTCSRVQSIEIKAIAKFLLAKNLRLPDIDLSIWVCASIQLYFNLLEAYALIISFFFYYLSYTIILPNITYPVLK